MTGLKVKLALFALKKAVKFLKDRPELIPGPVDDFLVDVLAKQLGV